MVWPALIVCSVLNTRCPVSEAERAISIVSRSRISPNRITFGAWRKAARKPVGKVRKILPHFPLAEGRLGGRCTNSIGSSSVTTWTSDV